MLKVRSFFSTQMMPHSKSQILETLFIVMRIFLFKIRCCQSNGFHGHFCPNFAFKVLIIHVEKSHAMQVILQSQNLWIMVLKIYAWHLRHLSSILGMNQTLQDLTTTTWCQIDHMNVLCFLVCFLLRTLPQFNLSLGVKNPCHLVIIDNDWGFHSWSKFLPMAKMQLENLHLISNVFTRDPC